MRKMLIISAFGILFSQMTEITMSYGETTKVATFYKNGSIKEEGIKVFKIKEGNWKYYDKNGFIIKMELYKTGKVIHALDLGEK